jgi:hypothetical protein
MKQYRCYKLNEKGEKVYLNDKWYRGRNHAKAAVTHREYGRWSNGELIPEHWYMEEYEPVLVQIVDEFDRNTAIRRR